MVRYILIIILSLVFISSDANAQEEVIYMCPMHPHITSTESGQTCPICGMDLVKKEIQSNASAKGENIVELTDALIQNSGVKTEKAKKRILAKSIRAFGELGINERLQSNITSRMEGWITKLNISAVGDKVKSGEPLYSIHAPDLVLAQRDYLRAQKLGQVRASKSSHKLFTHYDLDKAIVKMIEKSGKALTDVPYSAKRDGTVSQLNISEGSYVKLNTIIAKIQDYSSLWLNAKVAEKDISALTIGEHATISLPHQSDIDFNATIDYIYPTIDSTTRTATVRLLVDNKDGKLLVGNYVDVAFKISPKEALTIPKEAVLKDGVGARVIVSLGGGKFAVRKVKTGIKADGMVEVVDGVKQGDVIVVSGQFLIDSESSMQEASRKLSSEKTSDAPAANMGGAHAGH